MKQLFFLLTALAIISCTMRMPAPARDEQQIIQADRDFSSSRSSKE